tara:strand:- start:3 stop:194 length:192 start_codon:yes stop_codon:yes gene_type:complete
MTDYLVPVSWTVTAYALIYDAVDENDAAAKAEADSLSLNLVTRPTMVDESFEVDYHGIEEETA